MWLWASQIQQKEMYYFITYKLANLRSHQYYKDGFFYDRNYIRGKNKN